LEVTGVGKTPVSVDPVTAAVLLMSVGTLLLSTGSGVFTKTA
jgi:hypothetical protein